MIYPILISQQNFQAVTAQELSDYLRADAGEISENMDFYIQSATSYLETATRSTIIRKRYQMSLSSCHVLSHRLPQGPVAQLVSIESEGQVQNSADFTLKGDYLKLPKYYQSLNVIYDVGYDTADAIPKSYKMAILAASADLFVHRVTSDNGTAVLPLSHTMIHYYGNFFKNYLL
jgi:hypothetical protein